MARQTKLTLPSVGPTDGPLVSICINRQWVEIIESCVTRLEWPSAWIAGTDVDAAEQRAFELYLVLRNAVEGCNTDMGCCPETNAHLATLNTGITYEQALQNYENKLTEYRNATDKVAAIAPNYQTLTQAQQDTIMCQAWREMVKQLIAVEKERRQRAAGGLAAAGAILGIVAAIAGFLTGGAAWVAYIAISAAAVGAAGALFGIVTDETLNSTEAYEAIICCGYPRLRQRSPTRAVLAAALNQGCDLTVIQEDLRAALDAALDSDEAHLAFLTIIDDMSRQYKAGLIRPQNACEECVLESIIQWGGTRQNLGGSERAFNLDGWQPVTWDGATPGYTATFDLGVWNGANGTGNVKRNRIKTAFFNNKYVVKFRVSVTDYSYQTQVHVGDNGSTNNIVQTTASSGSAYFDIAVNRVVTGDTVFSAFRNNTVGTPPRWVSVIAYIQD